jgi:hypothetical protein
VLCEDVGEVETLAGKSIACPECVERGIAERARKCIAFLDAARNECGKGGSLRDAHDWMESLLRDLSE